jgi:glycosyltransferase involved in cell wall biosynthesis
MPRLSVLLPVRDAAPWLPATLASLARQTCRDFEVVAVDDGSRDRSLALLERAAARDPRVRVIATPPRGLPAALNTALAAARGVLVARHDADDLAHRERLALQVAHLARHPGTAVVGTRLRLFPAGAYGIGMRRWVAWHNALLTHEAMAAEALVDSVLAHGTACARRGALESVGGWAERGWAEDMDLWLRLLEAGHRFAKLDRVLYAWRQHPGSATRRDPRYARPRMDALRLEALRRGLLRGAEQVTLVAVGEALVRWSGLLGGAGLAVRAHAMGRPMPGGPRHLEPPLVLVFGAVPARARWREALRAAGRREGREFAFVA